MGEELEHVEDVTAERVLACDIIMVIIMIVFVGLHMRGQLDNLIPEKEIKKGRDIVCQIIRDFEKKDIYVDIGTC